MAAKKARRPTSIKLNLMPPYIAAARKTKMMSVLTVILCFLVFGGMGLWWRTNATEIARLNEDLERKKQEAQQVLEKQNKAQSIKQEVADITNALKVLDDIHKSGSEWTNILTKIASWIPEDVRLTGLNFEGSPTNAQSVVLMGYTTSVLKLRNFYSQLSQSALFTNVSIVTVDKNGFPVPVVGLPPVLPKEKPKAPEVAKELAPQGQQPTPEAGAAPTPMGGPGAGMPGPTPMGGPGAGMPGPTPMGGPGAGMPGPTPMGGPGAGMHAPAPMGGPAMPMMGMGGFAMGIGQQQQIVRDPTAPRNAVYFMIRATLFRPVQVASTLQPPQPAAGMPGAGMAPMGMGGMPPGGSPPEGESGGEAMTGAPGGASAVGRRRMEEE